MRFAVLGLCLFAAACASTRSAPATQTASGAPVAIASDSRADELAPCELQVIAVRYANATELERQVGALFRATRGLIVVADQRTNSLVVRGPKDAVADIQALVARLDKQAPQP
jgi:type II secretory pathway component GspD/PulD (secretin)